MILFRRVFVALVSLTSFFAVEAAEPAELKTCSLESSRDVIHCVMEMHPEIIRSETSLRQGESLEDVARQRPNPELSTRAVFGRNGDDATSITEINLSHTIELGAKRDARIDKARAERVGLGSESLKAREEIYVETFVRLHRLRQAQVEQRVLGEALETFSRIQKFYRGRPALSPEQRVSSGVFGLASGENQLRKDALDSEVKAIQRELSFSLGQNFPLRAELLPGAPKAWPAVTRVNDEVPKGGSLLQGAEANRLAALADVEMEKGNSWPDLKIGPSFEIDRQGSSSNSQFGLNLTFQIPILSTNRAGRAYAARGAEKAELGVRLARQTFDVKEQTLLTRYEDAVSSLKKASSLGEIEKSHGKMDQLFSRGLVPSALVIESHRQIYEFMKAQHEQELSAVDSLARLHALRGELSEDL